MTILHSSLVERGGRGSFWTNTHAHAHKLMITKHRDLRSIKRRFEQIELPAQLLDNFTWINTRNIHQSFLIIILEFEIFECQKDVLYDSAYLHTYIHTNMTVTRFCHGNHSVRGLCIVLFVCLLLCPIYTYVCVIDE